MLRLFLVCTLLLFVRAQENDTSLEENPEGASLSSNDTFDVVLSNDTSEELNVTKIIESNATGEQNQATTIVEHQEKPVPVYDDKMKDYKPRLKPFIAYEYSGYQYTTEISQIPVEPLTVAIGGRIAIDITNKRMRHSDWIDEDCWNCNTTVWIFCTDKGAEYFIREEKKQHTTKASFKQTCMSDYAGVTTLPPGARYVQNDTCKEGPCLKFLWEGDYFHPTEFYFVTGDSYDSLSKVIVYQRSFQGLFSFAIPAVFKEFRVSQFEFNEFQPPNTYAFAKLRENPDVPIIPEMEAQRRIYNYDPFGFLLEAQQQYLAQQGGPS